ncbi:hypothetical protein QBC47DRAFT_297957, partial [Echria macrotheca]
HWPAARVKTQVCLLKMGGLPRLKLHLSRCHYTSDTSAHSCKTCRATFLSEVNLKNHLDTNPKCIGPVRPDAFGPSGKGFAYSISVTDWDAISYATRHRTGSAEALWEQIWHILFPNHPTPLPYAETEFSSGDLFLLCQDLISTGSQQLSAVVNHELILSGRTTPAVISKFLEGFCRDWARPDYFEPSRLPSLEALGIINPQANSQSVKFGKETVWDTAVSNTNNDAKSPATASGSGVDKHDSSPPPLGDILVSDGSRFLPALSAAVRALIVAYEAESQIVTLYGMAGAAFDPTDAPESSPSQTTPSDSTGSLAYSGFHSYRTETTSQASSQRGDAPKKRDREEDDDPRKRPAPKRKRIEKRAKRLACPFQKRYPLKHFFCGAGGVSRGFVHISHIKDHIRRCHIRSVLYCPDCKEDFKSSEKFAEHVKQLSCEKQPFRDETALPPELAESLRVRVNKVLDLPEQWFSVWRTLFPGEDEPDNCFVDDVPEHMLKYQEFIERRGDETVRHVIRTHGLLPDRERAPNEDPECSQRNEEEMVAFAQRAFSLAARVIFRDWVADANQAQEANPSGGRSRQGGDTPRNKGKAPENQSTASKGPDQTNDETPPITRAPPAISTPSAVRTVPGGIVMDQRTNGVEDNSLTTFNPTPYGGDGNPSGLIQPGTTPPPALYGSDPPNLGMASNQAVDQEGLQGVAGVSDPLRDGGLDNSEISFDFQLPMTPGGTINWDSWDPTTLGAENSDSVMHQPPS